MERYLAYLFVIVLTGVVAPGNANSKLRSGDYEIRNFQFDDGRSLPVLNLHYRTIGVPTRSRDGEISNAVLLMHGTGSSGDSFFVESFADHLFEPGGVLDTTKYYIILPDAIGHGKSSRPSDGLRMAFPEYTYKDMVIAQYRLLTEHLKVKHLKLVMGTSMGGMHTWMWGYMYPDFMDALFPLASAPVEIAGRNRMMRQMIVNLIKVDPDWKDGNYETQPQGLTSAMYPLIFMVGSPLRYQQLATNHEAANQLLTELASSYATRFDANDLIYQFNSSRYYDPSSKLEEIVAPLVAVNTADDELNPPELGILKSNIKKVKRGRFVLLPVSQDTFGHPSYLEAGLWSNYLNTLLNSLEGSNAD